jgi:hypothetical protein
MLVAYVSFFNELSTKRKTMFMTSISFFNELAPVESPISVTGKSPCRQVNSLLDIDPYNQDRKVIMLVTDIPSNEAKLVKEEEEMSINKFNDVCPCSI